MERSKFFDISIPLNFDGEQPNAYGVGPATANAYEASGIIGDTRRGGSVNFEQYTFIPHCNGTHTECVGHITDQRISVTDCLNDVFITALLISVNPIEINGEMLITGDDIKKAVELHGGTLNESDHALVIRTLPNDLIKMTKSYGSEYIPPYFDADAMRYMVKIGVKHLLCDLPSIDRIFDEGKLQNHRIFWNVDTDSRELNANTRIYSTITELIYVDNEIPDGVYDLNLQIPHFVSDCAPSRPLLIKKECNS